MKTFDKWPVWPMYIILKYFIRNTDEDMKQLPAALKMMDMKWHFAVPDAATAPSCWLPSADPEEATLTSAVQRFKSIRLKVMKFAPGLVSLYCKSPPLRLTPVARRAPNTPPAFFYFDFLFLCILIALFFSFTTISCYDYNFILILLITILINL